MRPLLDEVLPRFDASEVHDLWIPAQPDVAFAAVKEVTVREVRLLTPLETLRGLPSLLTGSAAFRPDGSAPVLETFTVGLVPLGERPAPRSPPEPSAASGGGPATSRRRCGREDFFLLAGPATRRRRSRSSCVRSAVAPELSPRPASPARAPRRPGRCCATGLQSGPAAARSVEAGSPRSGAAPLALGREGQWFLHDPRAAAMMAAVTASRLRVPPVGLGLALVGLLVLAVVAASASGSPLPPGRPESSDLPGVVFLVAAGAAFALYVLAIVVIRRRRPSLVVVCCVAAAVQLIPLAGPCPLA